MVEFGEEGKWRGVGGVEDGREVDWLTGGFVGVG